MRIVVSFLIPFRRDAGCFPAVHKQLKFSLRNHLHLWILLALTSRPESPWDHSWFGTQEMLWLQRHV